MKSSEAPEKIYYAPYGDMRVNDPITENDIEYVHKDAFMKKAENFLEMLGYGFTITDNITHANYDKEQLIADFEEYLKK